MKMPSKASIIVAIIFCAIGYGVMSLWDNNRSNEVPPQTCLDYVLQDLKDKATLERAIKNQIAENEAEQWLIPGAKKPPGAAKK